MFPIVTVRSASGRRFILPVVALYLAGSGRGPRRLCCDITADLPSPSPARPSLLPTDHLLVSGPSAR